ALEQSRGAGRGVRRGDDVVLYAHGGAGQEAACRRELLLGRQRLARPREHGIERRRGIEGGGGGVDQGRGHSSANPSRRGTTKKPPRISGAKLAGGCASGTGSTTSARSRNVGAGSTAGAAAESSPNSESCSTNVTMAASSPARRVACASSTANSARRAT